MNEMEEKSRNLTEMSMKYRFTDDQKDTATGDDFFSNQPLLRKDASSLNATSLPLKAGVRQNLSCSDYVSTLLQVVVASSYFF